MSSTHSASTFVGHTFTTMPSNRPRAVRPPRTTESREWVRGPALTTVPEPTWDRPCEAMFEHLAGADPERLFRLVESGALPPGLLTHAAEWCGRTQRPIRARRALLPLLDSSSALVREGAIYGLALADPDEIVREALLVRIDPRVEASAGVRDAAREALEALG